jgi:N-acylglucosamine-6-phosphate 2-epimerase
MADVDSVVNGLRAADLGCEWVGTTLYGYTDDTVDRTPPAMELLPELRHELKTSVRLICEGGISTPSEARAALEAGADNVVVGTAITGVDLQVAAYRRGMAG